MSKYLWLFRAINTIGLLLTLGTSMSAYASFLGFSGESWKEEVLLHDGHKLIVERSQTRGGNHEIWQEAPIAEHKVSFTLPSTREVITWETRHDPSPSGLNDPQLVLLAIDVVNGVPYIVTTSTSCSSYNNWGRPNPPYVLFKYLGHDWHRVSLSEFPVEIKEANVVINISVYAHRLDSHLGTVTAEEVKEINEENERQDVRYLRLFVRKPINNADTNCSKFE